MLARWRDGEHWWIEEDEVLAEAREMQRERYEQDAWASKIDPYVRDKHKVRVSEILAEAIQLDASQWTLANQKRVGAHLRFNGWERRKYRDPLRDGHPTWYFFAPENDDGS